MNYRRPLIGVAMDVGMGHGRGILRGVMRYANLQRRWLLHQDLRPLPDDAWPACDGAVTVLLGGTLGERILADTRHIVSSGNADPAVTPIVCSDDQAIGTLAAQHLMDCRLMHFGYYGGPSPVSNNRSRGFAGALAARRLLPATLAASRLSGDATRRGRVAGWRREPCRNWADYNGDNEPKRRRVIMGANTGSFRVPMGQAIST